MLKRKYFKWMDGKRNPSKDALTFEESVQLLEDAIMKDCEILIKIPNCVGGMSDLMMDHFVQHMKFGFEMNHVRKFNYVIDLQEKKIEDSSVVSQRVCARFQANYKDNCLTQVK